MDMSFEHRTDVTEPEYMEMVRKKTGVLYAAAAGIGAVLAGGNAVQVKALYNFGLNTGIAFQIQDDLIDLLTPAEKSGKDQASDLREGKQTLVMIKAREKGLDLKKYQRALSPADIDAAIRELTDAGVIDEVQEDCIRPCCRQQQAPFRPAPLKRTPAPDGYRRVLRYPELLEWPGTIQKRSSFCAHCRTR